MGVGRLNYSGLGACLPGFPGFPVKADTSLFSMIYQYNNIIDLVNTSHSIIITQWTLSLAAETTDLLRDRLLKRGARWPQTPIDRKHESPGPVISVERERDILPFEHILNTDVRNHGRCTGAYPCVHCIQGQRQCTYEGKYNRGTAPPTWNASVVSWIFIQFEAFGTVFVSHQTIYLASVSSFGVRGGQSRDILSSRSLQAFSR